ncbi:MAG: helix-hairpin-helix domain-containing protein [Lachnospiraceae bacterium]|nr:helix-hairpin-helix domain-containing protein [Lachnospiraceae bacterium]
MKTKNRIMLTIFLLLLCLTACGAKQEQDTLVNLLDKQREEAVLPDETESIKSAAGQNVFVYICGEVVSPGVYEVAADSRIWDVLLKAGGFTEDASLESVNLARRVEDGMQIIIPSLAEAEEQKLKEERKAAGLVNLNTASLEELCSIPGIGESRARAILEYRERQGSFSAPEEIMQVDGIKEGLYTKLKDKIYVE